MDRGLVLGHPHVRGELALGSLSNRRETLWLLGRLPEAVVASDQEVLDLIDRRGLAGRGIGYTDAHLLAATLLTPPARLMTRDRRLGAVADALGLAWRGAIPPRPAP